jgi:hypothetical protein
MKRVIIGLAAACAVLALPAMASAQHACCDEAKTAACCEEKAPCCRHDNDPAAVAVLIPQISHQHQAARPAREQVLVKFWNPVRVGDRILMGKYIIEHDTDRMAQGGPCTYIYEFGKALPVVAFHCVHLDRPFSERATVTLRPTTDGSGMKELTEFQLSGESAGHGVPAAR